MQSHERLEFFGYLLVPGAEEPPQHVLGDDVRPSSPADPVGVLGRLLREREFHVSVAPRALENAYVFSPELRAVQLVRIGYRLLGLEFELPIARKAPLSQASGRLLLLSLWSFCF